ncbi:hypothetical protein [Candidatus Hakubella thermalkaliphila]|nr:hypothetical protein [Candidatus Hakubella thermalkaliphila]
MAKNFSTSGKVHQFKRLSGNQDLGMRGELVDIMKKAAELQRVK